MQSSQLSELRAAMAKPKDAADPRPAMLAKLGDISGVELFHNQALCMVFVQDKIGLIHRPDVSKAEDLYQGKVGLVVALGPTAFKNDPEGRWTWKTPINIGDWLAFRASDSLLMKVNGVECRLLTDTAVRARIDNPTLIW